MPDYFSTEKLNNNAVSWSTFYMCCKGYDDNLVMLENLNFAILGTLKYGYFCPPPESIKFQLLQCRSNFDFLIFQSGICTER